MFDLKMWFEAPYGEIDTIAEPPEAEAKSSSVLHRHARTKCCNNEKGSVQLRIAMTLVDGRWGRYILYKQTHFFENSCALRG
jgi:hypothetical protein